MQNNGGGKNLAETFFHFFKGMARRPFMVFLVLLSLAALATGLIFFNFYRMYFATETLGTVSAGGAFFNEAKAGEYRKIFSTIDEREKEYREPAISTDAP